MVPRVESDEYAVITNDGGSAIDLAGYRLNAGAPGQDFWFPSYVLQPGASCRVYTNEIHGDSCGGSFGVNEAYWNNGGDCGYLYNAAGTQVSDYCY
ncbi:MAG: lamin tail domain-containing protein [Caldilineaceae bacterium]|nr:lamin tail domain-containing protein [Caldilineaceae bacterium]